MQIEPTRLAGFPHVDRRDPDIPLWQGHNLATVASGMGAEGTTEV
jgi:hypothetical protein